jgi:hypothetical protein
MVRHSGIIKGYDGIFVVVIALSISFLVSLAMNLVGLIIVTTFGATR